MSAFKTVGPLEHFSAEFSDCFVHVNVCLTAFLQNIERGIYVCSGGSSSF